MAKGPTIEPFIRTRVAELYKLLSEEKGRPPTGPEVHERLHQEQGKRMFPVALPGLRVVQQILTNARRGFAEEKESDRPWSLGESATPTHRIPPEANKELLYIWRWCIVVGRTFTVREAQWVARLRGVVPLNELHAIAFAYALREWASKALGMVTDTADLDAELAFRREGPGEWSHQTALRMGVISGFTEALLKEHETNKEALEFLHLRAAGNMASQMVLFDLGLKWYLPHELPENADLVFAMWLRHFSKGPNWENTADEGKKDIAARLYEEVAEVSKEIEDLSSKSQPWLVYSKSRKWKPSEELLKKVGYEVDRFNEGA